MKQNHPSFIMIFFSISLSISSLFAETTHAEMSPLLKKIEQLYCANSEAKAKSLLEEFLRVPHYKAFQKDFALPDEHLGQKQEKASLYSATLDNFLWSLAKTVKRYPTLRPEVERVALQWNYCDIYRNYHEEEQFYNLFYDEGEVAKKRAADDAPLKWQGFERWGFLPDDPKDRFVPELLSDSPLGPRAFHQFFHRIYRKHCFPHPDTGERYYEANHNSPWRPLKTLPKTTPQDYPFAWKPFCEQKPKKKPKPKPKPIAKPKPIKKPEPKKETPPPPPKVTKKEPKPAPIVEEVIPQEEEKVWVIAEPEPVIEEVIEIVEPVKIVKPKPKIEPKPIIQAKPEPIQEELIVEAEPEFIPQEKDQVVPVAPAVAAGAHGASPVIFIDETNEGTEEGTKAKKNKLSLGGDYYLRIPLDREKSDSIGASISWAPKQYWFLRTKLDLRLNRVADHEERLSYSWGAGYDDWHPGSWSVQVNNWGPLTEGDGFAWEKAVINIGHKFKGKWLEDFNLAGNASVDFPTTGQPSFTTMWQWSPKKNWYMRLFLVKPLNGEDLKWMYGFGYYDWRPNVWRTEYANYGPNQAFQDNFQENGAVTISRGWQY